MFGCSAHGPFAPQPKRPGLETRPHQLDHFARLKAKLLPNRVEGRAVLPRHLNDAIGLRSIKSLDFFRRFHLR